MRLFVSFLLFVAYLSASSLSTYNVYKRSDRVDIMLSFDAPYDGKIYQNQGKNFISLTLSDLSYNNLVEKNLDSPIVQKLTIQPVNESTIISLQSNKPIGIYASKTPDGFGLRIRSKVIAPPITKPKKTTKIQTKKDLPTSIIDKRYIMVIGVMLLLLIFLYWLKWKIKRKNSNSTSANKGKSWLFKGDIDRMDIISQKIIDGHNRIVLFSYQNKQYLVLSGSTNILLDKFEGGKSVKDEDDFKNIFEQNRQKLDDYLKLQQTTQLNSYKEKASQDFPIQEEPKLL